MKTKQVQEGKTYGLNMAFFQTCNHMERPSKSLKGSKVSKPQFVNGHSVHVLAVFVPKSFYTFFS